VSRVYELANTPNIVPTIIKLLSEGFYAQAAIDSCIIKRSVAVGDVLMSGLRLETEHLLCEYNEEQALVWVTFHGAVGPDVSVQMYDWLEDTLLDPGTQGVRGGIFDFRPITAFQEKTLETTRRQRKDIAHSVNMDHIPMALLVGNALQEQIVSITMKATRDVHQRIKLVYSLEEAHAHINTFHAQSSPASDNS